jgi:putative cardiolipin synthase
MRALRGVGVLVLLVFLVAGCGGGGKKLPMLGPQPKVFALEPEETGPLSTITERLRPRLGPGESGFMLMPDSADALRLRLMLIDSARQTLDFQYFFWKGDAGGYLLISRVITAADRGVRVRILLDDLNLKPEDDTWGAALALHPNINLKFFNPWKKRSKGMMEFLTSMRRLNQRMHNKIMLADGHVAIVGGRNIGDNYWGLNPRFNSIDLELLSAGPVIDEVEQSFDDYWNHPLSYPVDQMGYEVTPEDLQGVRTDIKQEVDDAREALASFSIEPKDWTDRIDSIPDRMISGRSWVLYDIPATDRRSRPQQLYETLSGAIGEVMEKEILIASAYFVPQAEFVDETLKAVDRGVEVRILTNSLASNPGTASHAGYKRYRRALLLAGADLYELRPDAEAKPDYETAPNQGEFLGLHTKSIVVDRKYSFVGSLNVDPRSVIMNTEVGIVVESEALAEQVIEAIEKGMTPENSWHVILNDKKKVEWVTEGETLRKEPARDTMQRFVTWIIGAFANENWL